MKTLRIRPAAGRVVRDPDLHDLITGARTVPDSPFWRRRLRDGDVTPDDSPPGAPEPVHEPTTQAGAPQSKRTGDKGETP
ncbi:DUF2635 domain-containing protein [Paraburkholderia caffeinilytica]|uniref:DUF2635 domain-containing protein n=1 Tax=Paraburkholderia caffeinilytica TaxID=1761016 RepID=UPI003DA02D57